MVIMRQHLIATVGFSLLFSGMLTAAEFWETKPFLTWSDKEAEKVMTDSPWAVTVGVALPPPLPRESGAGAQGGRGGDDTGFGPVPRRIQLQIAWRSALPLRQALVRNQIGQDGTPSPQHQEFLTLQPTSYVIAIRNLPVQYSRGSIEAFLKRKGKPAIPVEEAGTEKTAAGPVLLIGFSAADPITLDEGDVELTFKSDRFEFKRKFTLKNMMFGGKLEL
jgi:hypothetical protein